MEKQMEVAIWGTVQGLFRGSISIPHKQEVMVQGELSEVEALKNL